MIGRLALAPVLAALLVAGVPVQARDRAFSRLVDRLEAHYQKAPMGTGFLGFLARCFSPEGVSGLRMAIFEEVDSRRAPLGADFDAFVQRTVGPDRTPMVRISRKDGERVYLYARPQGERVELLVVAAESTEAVVLSMKVDPERFQAWMEDPEGMARKRGN